MQSIYPRQRRGKTPSQYSIFMPSLFNYKWELLNQDPNLDVFEKVLWNRGINVSDLEKEELFSPWLFPDMEKSVKRIQKAIENKERVIIFGDYDADGITGTAILVRTLQELGAEVSYRLPNRETDGYGLNTKFIDEFLEAKVDLIITVDCGISNKKEIEKAQKSGIDVIITDHHAIPKTPPKAHAIIHPENYTFKHLSGSGVAYKLSEALLGEKAHKYIDLAAIGTIADIVPLYGENRTIARLGLKQMARTKWKGITALKEVPQVKSEDLRKLEGDLIGYRMAPRLNAAGRLSDPYISLQLLISDTDKTTDFAKKLDEINRERQELVKSVIEKITYNPEDKIILVAGKWPQGISGLIAGKITEEHHKPCLALTENEDMLVGSARSPEYFDITEGLKKIGDLLEEYGGHAQAAGFTIKKENLGIFKEKLLSLKIKPTPKRLLIDCEITGEEYGDDLYKSLQQLKPFGEKNEKPLFLLDKIFVKEARNIGADKNHIRIKGVFGKKIITAVKFNTGSLDISDLTGKEISLVASLIKDNFGPAGYSLMIQDLKVGG